MPVDSVDVLLSVLCRAQIFSPEQAQEIVRELGPLYTDPQQLGEYLVEIEWLTAYQLQLVLTERWDELIVGPYQVLDRLGEGGVSEVFKAWDTVKGRVVALKALRHGLAATPDVLRQFQRELEAITRLSHPNIIKTYDAQELKGASYFAMEFVEGMDLQKFVQQAGPLPVEQACDYARQVAQGLQHAHQVGLVHRDIKPANLFLLNPPLPAPPGAAPRRAGDPLVKILDWGLARCLREPAAATNGEANGHAPAPQQPSPELDAEKGKLIGTADFIAPEQARDATLVDTRADIYSLGCTLYFMLTAQPPFPGASLMKKLLRHQEAAPPSIRELRPDMPEELDQIIQKMLAKQPADRFQIPLLVVAPLRRFCTGGVGRLASGACIFKPGSSGALRRPGSTVNMPRPSRPSTVTDLSRPGTSLDLPHPGQP
jgi:serine/threonine-protein kinase